MYLVDVYLCYNLIKIYRKLNKEDKLMAPLGLLGLIPTVASFRELLKGNRNLTAVCSKIWHTQLRE